MKKLLKVIYVEMREQLFENIVKSHRHEYARGGFKQEETIRRVTRMTPFALLECGHWRREDGSGAVISTARRLSCYVCSASERTSVDIVLNTTNNELYLKNTDGHWVPQFNKLLPAIIPQTNESDLSANHHA